MPTAILKLFSFYLNLDFLLKTKYKTICLCLISGVTNGYLKQGIRELQDESIFYMKLN